MKALILAAGLGQRLLPSTEVTPKPLFTLDNTPMLEITINRLIDAGVDEILVNTHHLHWKIDLFLDTIKFSVPVTAVHEPKRLETGGAIRNVKSVMEDGPFFVVNSDVVSDIDLRAVWEFHQRGTWTATLVMHDLPRFNKVEVNSGGFVQSFDAPGSGSPLNSSRVLAFTGIQVLSPDIYDFMPDRKHFSSIDLYKRVLARGNRLKAYLVKNHYWCDIGTPDAYMNAAVLAAAAGGFHTGSTRKIRIEKLAGDGSDRSWFRARHNCRSLVIVHHGIQPPLPGKSSEAEALVNIGTHLFNKGIPVPAIKNVDRFSGTVAMADLGDTHLQRVIEQEPFRSSIVKWYKKACDLAVDFSIKGMEDFHANWTWQTEKYSRQLILEQECRYFTDAFLNTFLQFGISFRELKKEFEHIADNALASGFSGLMHRDMQSRNIMVKENRLFFIDFQGARRGPLQYDLASLLIDPYAALAHDVKEEMLAYTAHKIETGTGFAKTDFIRGFRYCAVARNLQILGAFAHLSINRKKLFFRQYIPGALEELKRGLGFLDPGKTERLSTIVHGIQLQGTPVRKASPAADHNLL
ncbi:MAG: sugar phosphate nucleotidyltransferase [Desulfobacteraceae bacterium]